MTKEKIYEDNETPQNIKVDEGDGSVIVGETTYKSAEEVFKGKLAADNHITVIEAENRELRETLEESRKKDNTAMETLMENVERLQMKKEDEGQGEEEYKYTEGEPGETNTSKTKMTRGDLQAMIRKEAAALINQERHVTSENSLKDLLATNKDTVKQALIEKVGSEDEAKAVYKRYTDSTEYDDEIHTLQLRKNPADLLKAILDKGQATIVNFGSGMSQGGRSSPLGGSVDDNKPRPRSYYAKMMKENERKYYTPEVQAKMKRDAETLGTEAFLAK